MTFHAVSLILAANPASALCTTPFHLCSLLLRRRANHTACAPSPPAGGATAAVPASGKVAARVRQLEPAGRGVEGLPGGQAEGRGGGPCCLAPHPARGGAHTGAGAGEYCPSEGGRGKHALCTSLSMYWLPLYYMYLYSSLYLLPIIALLALIIV